jgi:predicted molibdopterin-dependent oxidoreductase YjgC
VVLIGARPDYTHPVLARNVRRAVRKNGAALIQFDPLVTPLTSFARIHWRAPFDVLSDVLVKVMEEIVLGNLHDAGFLQAQVRNGDELLAQLRPKPQEEEAPEELNHAARLIGGGRKTVFLLGHMAAGAARGYILSRLAANLALLCGRPDSVIFLFDGPNEAGMRLVGCVPDRLPGALVAKDRSTLEHLRLAWKTQPVTERGLDAMEMIRAGESGELKSLLLFGVDPFALFPETDRIGRALSNMSLVVRAGMFPPVGAEAAHAVLPTTAVTETDGTYVNIEGRIQRVTKIMDPPGHARASARAILDLAGLLGSPLGFITAKEVFEEITSICPSWNRVKWAQAGQPGGVRPGGPSLAAGASEEELRFVPYLLPGGCATSSGSPPDSHFKLYPEEQTGHPGDGVQSRMSFRLSAYNGSDTVRLHPEYAERLGLTDGRRVVVRSAAGEFAAVVKLDPDVPEDGLVVPAAGPRYFLQKVLPWPEEHCPLSWDRIFVTVSPVEEE